MKNVMTGCALLQAGCGKVGIFLKPRFGIRIPWREMGFALFIDGMRDCLKFYEWKRDVEQLILQPYCVDTQKWDRHEVLRAGAGLKGLLLYLQY